MSERLPQIAPVRDGLPFDLSASPTAPASDWPSAFVSWSYPTGAGWPFGSNSVRQPAGWLSSMNCCGMREITFEKTSGVSTLPTDPAISIATPPKRCCSFARKKWIQSAVIHFFCASSGLNPSDSACWLTFASVAITLPFVPTACRLGICWSSTKGYDDQHWRRFDGSFASA